ncbi:MAG TPA: hypothetical protein VFV99_03740, partial [Kofleriaceae bacterium]|nr:hypothetical protein [Kofleriaceae bacterium]
MSSAAPQVAEPLPFGAPVAPASAKPAQPVPLWHARPGVPIAAVFATEDGSAVVSIDESNHARLWPTLDGKSEPWVLPLGMPVEAVVERDGDRFAIAARDESGGVEIVAVTANGELTADVKLSPEPGFDAVIENGDGFLALRRDQTLVQFDRHGEEAGKLVPPPGEHVMKLLHRGGRTLALVRTKEGMRGHWVAADALAWSDITPKLAINLEHVFLSPDHQRLVTFSNSRGEHMLVDLETGKSSTFARDDKAPEGFPAGFMGSRLVFAFNDFELSELQWWTPNGNEVGVVGGSNYALEFVAMEHPVVTDNNVIAFSGHEIAIATMNTASSPSQVRFLGYRTSRAKGVKSSPVGVVATIGSVATLLDDNVRVDKRVPALETIPFAKDLALIKFTATDWGEPVVNVSNGIDPDWLEDPNARPTLRGHSTPRIALFDLERKTELQRWPSAGALHYEPATKLMAAERGNKITFSRFDPATRKFTDETMLTAPGSDVTLLDPALAGGNIALLTRARKGAVSVRAIRDLAAAQPAPTELTGNLEAIDRAGRIYLRVDADTIVVHGSEGEQRITGMTGWTLRPSPTGTQIAAVGKSRLMLLDARGQSVWSVGFPGVRDAAWTSEGALVVL